ncbi:MAG TPA: riboflavin biosynthesis protein RibF [Polyangiaceae bacterium]|nr:riboflavin biosynthesis protein RibF [Polyangiaceae bacterium]
MNPAGLEPTPSGPTLCAIGNFDGVHRGHVEVLRQAAREAELQRASPVALTFDPPPAVVLGRSAPALLTTLERKIELIAETVPAIRVVVKTFDRDLAQRSAEEFATTVLAGELHAVCVVVGQNFRFGRAREGDLGTLKKLGEKLGFTAHSTELVGDDKGPWSSTRVRRAVQAGDFADVEGVLGRPHSLTGTVMRGDQRGRTLGFPTANLGGVEELVPPYGVYAVVVDRLDRPGISRALAKGVANIGVRPTVGAGASIEAHLLDFQPATDAERDLYGARLRFHLVAFLRGEQKFASLDALRAQIGVDANAAKAILASRKPVPDGLGGWY